MPRLFSYGTLQQQGVQLETFGRELSGYADVLLGYVVGEVKIHDAAVLQASGKDMHPILQRSDALDAKVPGIVFEITDAELQAADAYEVDAYARVWCEDFSSGYGAWVYVDAREV